LQRRGDVAGARRSLLRALEIDSRNTTALVAITNLDLATRRGEATARVDAAAARHPRDAGILMVAARTHAANGDLVRAESELKQIIEIDPSKLEAYHALGQLYVRQKNLDGAVTWYQQRLQKKPQDIGAHTMVGMIRIVQGKHTEARADFERALAIDPRAAVASNNLAYLDAEAGTNLDIALNRAQTAMAALPDDADVSDTLGWVYVKRGLPALAISRFQHAIQKSPSNPLYHYHLGLAYAKAGDNEHARSSLRQALKLSPSFEGAAVAKQMLNGLGG